MKREPGETVKRTCRWCGRKFVAQKGEAKRRECPECEPPLIPREQTVMGANRERV